MDPQRRSGLPWNVGGWLGAQLGCTAWILISALIVMPRDRSAGLAALTFWLIANAIGTAMWMQRERLDPYRALQALIVVAGLTSVAATWVLDRAGQFESLGVGGQVSARAMYLMLAIGVVGLLLLFHLIQRQAQR